MKLIWTTSLFWRQGIFFSSNFHLPDKYHVVLWLFMLTTLLVCVITFTFLQTHRWIFYKLLFFRVYWKNSSTEFWRHSRKITAPGESDPVLYGKSWSCKKCYSWLCCFLWRAHNGMHFTFWTPASAFIVYWNIWLFDWIQGESVKIKYALKIR